MAFQLNPQLIKDALSRAANELPPLPNVLVRVLQLTESADSGTVGEVETLIRSDQAISSRLLRIVNTAYFGLSGQVSSISQAIVILGFQQVRNLVLSVSMMSQFSATSEKTKDAQVRLWETAFCTAGCAQYIAKLKKFDSKESELAFVGGLLQNIGSLFMLNALVRPYLSALEEVENNRLDLATLETARFSTNHAEIGQELLTKWKLPENLILVVGRHEGPFAGEPIPSLFAVHIAERFANLVLSGDPFSVEGLALDEEKLAWMNMSPEELEETFNITKRKLTEASDLINSM